MASQHAQLNQDFGELMERVRRGREFSHSSFEPIYYLVFHPEEMLEVKRKTASWLARLKNDNWEVSVFSMAEHVQDILASAPLRKIGWRVIARRHSIGKAPTRHWLTR